MARILYTGLVSADGQSGVAGLASYGASTLYIQMTDGGGSGANNLTVNLQGTPNPGDSVAAQVFINDDTGVFPALVVEDTALPYTKIVHLDGAQHGSIRFDFDISGVGDSIYNVTIWANP